MNILQLIRINKKILDEIFLSFKYYFSQPKGQPLLAALPRAGSHLTYAMLEVCFSMQDGLPGEIVVQDGDYRSFGTPLYASESKNHSVRALDERSSYMGTKSQQFWTSYNQYEKILPERKKFCKTIVLIREPVSWLKSDILREEQTQRLNRYFEKEMSLDEFFVLDKKHNRLSRYKNFLNSWKKRKIASNENKSISVEIIDLDFIKFNTLEYLKFLNNYFQYNFTNEQMNKAVELLDYNRISSMLPKKSIRISREKIKLSKQVLDYVKSKCEPEYLEIKALIKHNLTKNFNK